jgi:hypothetical protein
MTKASTRETVLKYCLYNYKESHHDKLPATPPTDKGDVFSGTCELIGDK